MELRFWQGLPRLPSLVMASALVMSVLGLGGPALADAEDNCIAVAGIGASIDKFLGAARAAQDAGVGALPINDVLFGVTEISPAHQRELDARAKVRLTKRDALGGDYESRGPRRITVEGIFAERDTLFRLPKKVLGRYVLNDQGVTLTYDPEHTVEVGERVLGIRFFKDMHHTIITRDKLSFFFGDNDGDEPDRCYEVVRE